MKARHRTAGRCHCGNIRFEFDSSVPRSELPVRVCGCAFCIRHGARYTSDPGGAVRVEIDDGELVQRYAFGHRTAEFILCRRCGCVPLATSVIDGKTYAIININVTNEPEAFSRPPAAFDYDDETVEERLTRRKEKWIGTVTMPALCE